MFEKGDPKKKSYKELNGTTRVGDFLRSIGKSKLLGKLVDAGMELATGSPKEALKTILTTDKDLTKEEMQHALNLLKLDLDEQKEISSRWASDMESDSWLSKNIRPLSLAYLTFSTTLIIILDSSQALFVKDNWIDLLQSLLLTVYFAYFGGRTYEKTKKRQ
ncbi:hypothetical protein [uncultured Winogradskyella sp.]|uniref:hypothetical protein n=1 Tax=uncultured Winogradskyella sp. TaxID=395353 RepID=UPI002637F556|nr:hypothetical protein [uncultured Winogradskyella sp.]